MLLFFLLAILVSAFVSFLATPLVRNFFIRQNWIEDPCQKNLKSGNATATSPVPRGGGLPVFFAFFFTSLLFLPLDTHLIAILLACLLTLIVGLIDDIKDIHPLPRLFTNLIAALIVISSGIGISYLSNPFGGIINLPPLLGSVLAIFWIVWCTNAVGWSAGIEGQLPGFVAIAAIFIALLGLRFSADITQWPVIILAAALSGAYLGFLPYNFYPQSIMPGYSGKSLAGFLLALLSILSGAKLATLLFLLGLPMIDALLVIARRFLQGKSIFFPDSSHFHHQLLKLGYSRRRIALFYWLITLVLGIISLFLNSQQKFYTFLGIALIIFSLIIKAYQRT